MKEETELNLMLLFTIGYLSFFTILALLNNNYEFLYYTIVMVIIIFIIILYHKKIHLPVWVMSGLAIVGALHIFGGNIHIKGIRLYDIWLIPNLLKYDNIVHFIGSFTVAIVVYSLIYPHLDKKLEHSKILLSTLLIFIATGIGALNEILELSAVIYFNASQQVGDYFNNAFDLLYNLLGSILSCFFLMSYHKKIYLSLKR